MLRVKLRLTVPLLAKQGVLIAIRGINLGEMYSKLRLMETLLAKEDTLIAILGINLGEM